MSAEIKDERKFLHDIATPIGTALFLIDSVVETSESGPIGPEEIAHLKQILASLLTVKSMLQERRNVLISRDNAN